VFYADLRLSYEVPVGGSTMQIWGSVTNLFDKAPPATGYYSTFTGASAQYNASLFDVLGRRYTVGVKFKL
jgi:outer membrane receptor protein involved in Fe transport